jgi:integrase/recombinase XerD
VPENDKRRSGHWPKLSKEYLGDVKLTHKPRSYAAYATALNYFMESCHKLYVEDVDRRDLLKFSVFLRDEREHAPRTVYNKFEHAMTFLKAQGDTWTGGQERLAALHGGRAGDLRDRKSLINFSRSAMQQEKLWYEFFLMTGMREQEVMFTYWSDVNVAASIDRVTHQSDRGWTPKAYREREIPIPAKLAK